MIPYPYHSLELGDYVIIANPESSIVELREAKKEYNFVKFHGDENKVYNERT